MTIKSKALVKTIGNEPDDLERLLAGEPVMYAVKNQRSVFLDRDPILIITPISFYNADSSNGRDLLVSLEGSGCWFVPTYPRVQALDIFYSGLSMIASIQLANRLNAIFHGDTNE